MGQVSAILAIPLIDLCVELPNTAETEPRDRGGLYHVITRGNDWQNIFHSDEDHVKFLSLLTAQEGRLLFTAGAN
jgi:hypothetical protein